MLGNLGGWIFIVWFLNVDGKNWMRDDVYWWYDIQFLQGFFISIFSNYDMILEVFWKVQGSEIKIICSDDSLNFVFFCIYNNCFGGKIYRGFMFVYGKFSYCNVWFNNQCFGSCLVYFGGLYQIIVGFS